MKETGSEYRGKERTRVEDGEKKINRENVILKTEGPGNVRWQIVESRETQRRCRGRYKGKSLILKRYRLPNN